MDLTDDGGSPERCLARAVRRLESVGVPSPRVDAEELLGYVLDVPRSRLPAVLASVDAPAAWSDDRRAAFEDLVERRAGREPLQHLLGTVTFRTVGLAVGPGVFVPRPETESVAGAAIDAVRRAVRDTADGGADRRPIVVDLGTGSGAIALAVATEVPAARVCACELDPDAHRWAMRNLAGSGVQLERADAAGAFPELNGRVDVVVSNPPYIPLTAWESVEPEVRDHDPAAALWSGQDGLDMIAVVERAAARLLRPDGTVVVEHASVQAESAPAIFARAGGWTVVRDHLDLAGRPRFVTATRSAADQRTVTRPRPH